MACVAADAGHWPWSFESALGADRGRVRWRARSSITPSLAYMAEVDRRRAASDRSASDTASTTRAWGVGLLDRAGARRVRCSNAMGFASCCSSPVRRQRRSPPSLLLGRVQIDRLAHRRRCYETHQSRGLAGRVSLLVARVPSAPRRRPLRRENPRRVRRHARPHGEHVRRQRPPAKALTSTVAVKGDRKATLNDTTGQIIDLTKRRSTTSTSRRRPTR